MGREAKVQQRKAAAMKFRICTILVVVLVAAVGIAAPSANPSNSAGVGRVPQPNIMNPTGMGTVPPTTYTQAAPNRRYDIYAGGGVGNLIVTGDVGSGRQFRGVVPYSSVNSFGGTTQTGRVDQFLKDTEPAGYGTIPGAARPYYVPMRTVSKMPAPGMAATSPAPAPGQAAPLTPQQARPEEVSMQNLAEEYRPLSRTPQEMADLILKQSPASQTETSILKAINDARQKEILDQLEQIKAQAAELAAKTQKPGDEVGAVTVEPAKTIDTHVGELPERGPSSLPQVEQKPVDIYDRMLQQVDKDYDEYVKSRQEGAAGQETAVKTQGKEAGTEKTQQNEGLTPSTSGQRLDPKQLNAEGYKLYMTLSAEYMKQKRFYKAAETYALARSFVPDDATSLQGQGWALFATGEYMSSAYYLGRAIAADPNMASKKVDLKNLIGGDMVQQRISDLAKWQQQTYSPELQFLLAYAYYQTGNKRDAEDEIRAAAVKMEAYRPAVILKDVIVGGK
jgi:tetratricopeptide (TPR) repeat protein